MQTQISNCDLDPSSKNVPGARYYGNSTKTYPPLLLALFSLGIGLRCDLMPFSISPNIEVSTLCLYLRRRAFLSSPFDVNSIRTEVARVICSTPGAAMEEYLAAWQDRYARWSRRVKISPVAYYLPTGSLRG